MLSLECSVEGVVKQTSGGEMFAKPVILYRLRVACEREEGGESVRGAMRRAEKARTFNIAGANSPLSLSLSLSLSLLQETAESSERSGLS